MTEQSSFSLCKMSSPGATWPYTSQGRASHSPATTTSYAQLPLISWSGNPQCSTVQCIYLTNLMFKLSCFISWFHLCKGCITGVHALLAHCKMQLLTSVGVVNARAIFVIARYSLSNYWSSDEKQNSVSCFKHITSCPPSILWLAC